MHRRIIFASLTLAIVLSAAFGWAVYRRHKAQLSASPIKRKPEPTVANFTFDARDEDDDLLPQPFIKRSESEMVSWATHKVDPVYPESAKSSAASGDVVVKVIVNEQGRVIWAQARSGSPLLYDAALTAARRWRFEAWERHGVRLKVIGSIRFSFQPQS